MIREYSSFLALPRQSAATIERSPQTTSTKVHMLRKCQRLRCQFSSRSNRVTVLRICRMPIPASMCVLAVVTAVFIRHVITVIAALTGSTGGELGCERTSKAARCWNSILATVFNLNLADRIGPSSPRQPKKHISRANSPTVKGPAPLPQTRPDRSAPEGATNIKRSNAISRRGYLGLKALMPEAQWANNESQRKGQKMVFCAM